MHLVISLFIVAALFSTYNPVLSCQETSKKSVLKAIAAQDMLQDETESKTGLDEMADKKKLGLAGGLP